MSESKRIKNLISIAILLGGLFAGSLFVDVAQLVSGSGFSERNLSKSEIFETSGKTWVAYGEPLVKISVITDDACGDNCNPSEALVWLRRVMPTISAQKVVYDSAEGKALINKAGIKTLPAFVFDQAIVKTDFYSQAQVLFDQKDKLYVLKTQELGLAPGKYVSLPAANDGDATFGAADSKVKVFVFSDFQCPYCKIFWNSLRQMMKQYSDKAFFDYKHLALASHPQANNAALASECALEQGKFWEYGDKLFAVQNDWSNASGTQKFKNYAASLRLDQAKFNQCVDNKKYQDKINSDKNEADSFGIAGTPSTFINDQFKSGVITQDDLKASIEQELGK